MCSSSTGTLLPSVLSWAEATAASCSNKNRRQGLRMCGRTIIGAWCLRRRYYMLTTTFSPH